MEKLGDFLKFVLFMLCVTVFTFFILDPVLRMWEIVTLWWTHGIWPMSK